MFKNTFKTAVKAVFETGLVSNCFKNEIFYKFHKGCSFNNKISCIGLISLVSFKSNIKLWIVDRWMGGSEDLL
jgi:hypothetical protein